ncbi:hypothetical protein K502DRAFT_324412 [Neoconidiobolus thromboides FSU 785]|nr:hypothetical protein K502DRAFT_324412 [Neoconidiobolus thromboides FSU 785]
MSQKSSDDNSSNIDDLVDDLDKNDPNEALDAIKLELEKNSYQYELHLKLITEAKAQNNYDELNEARKNMSNLFPLDENLWIEWLNDEINLSFTKKEKENVITLFDKATDDYLMIGVWKLYLDFMVNNFDHENDKMEEALDSELFSLNQVREVFNRAINATDYHIAEGHLIWDGILEFELSILEKETSSDEQKQYINSLYVARFLIPHKNITENFEAYSQFVSKYYPQQYEAMMKSANSNYSTSLKELLDREPFEEKLKDTHSLEVYTEYIKYELGQKSRLKSKYDNNLLKILYQRVIAKHPLQIQLWEAYLAYLAVDMKDNENFVKACYQSIRNCNWSGTLWAGYLRSMENTLDLGSIDAFYSHALGINLIQSNPEEFLKLLLERIAIYRRKLLPTVTTEVDETIHETINNMFKDTVETLNQFGDPECKVLLLWANIEVIYFRDIAGARKIWTKIMKTKKNEATYWVKQIDFESRYGDISKILFLFKKAIQTTTDYPEYILQAWEDYVRIYNFEDSDIDIMFTIARQRTKINEQYQESLIHQTAGEQLNEAKKERARVRDRANKAKKRAKNKDHNEKDQSDNNEDNQNDKLNDDKSELRQDKGYEYNNNDPKLPTKNLSQEEINRRNEETTVFVCNFRDLTREYLHDLFSKYGKIVEVRKPTSPARKERNFAYVQFETKEETEASLELNGYKLDNGMELSVRLSSSKKENQKRPAKDLNINPCKLFVSNLPKTYTQQDILNLFKQFGAIKDINMIKDFNGLFKGICFVHFDEEEFSNQALSLNSTIIEGHPITVSIADPTQGKNKKQNIEPKESTEVNNETEKINKQDMPYIKRSNRKTYKRQINIKKVKQEENSEIANLSKEEKKELSNSDFRSLLLGKKD